MLLSICWNTISHHDDVSIGSSDGGVAMTFWRAVFQRALPSGNVDRDGWFCNGWLVLVS